MDDLTLSGDLDTVEKDVVAIEQAATETGLPLNRTKCEIIMEDFSKISTRNTFKDFIKVEREEMTLLGSPVSEGKAQDAAIMQKTDELQKAMKRLALLYILTTHWSF